MNKLMIIGRLTADPTTGATPSNVGYANFTVASDTRVKDSEKGGNITNFYRVTAWRGLSEICSKYLHKGDPVSIVGDLVYRTYVDRNGVEKGQLSLTATDVELISPARKSGGEAAAAAPVDSDDSLDDVFR